VGVRGWSVVASGALTAVVSLASSSGKSPTDKTQASFEVVSSVEISADEPAVRHVETALAVSPRDPKILVAASIAFGKTDGVPLYATGDGGRTWQRGVDRRGKSVFLDGLDPAVSFDEEGTAYALSTGDQLGVAKSTDGGVTWLPTVVVPGDAWDRPWIGNGGEGRVYVAGKLPVSVFGHVASDIIAVSSSTDRGASFSFPRLFLPAPEKAALNIVSDVAVLPDERLLLALQLFAPEALRESPLHGFYGTIVSSDRGRTFGPPRPGPEFRTFGHAWEGKSLFGLGGARFAVDRTKGPRGGRLYLTWLGAEEGFYRVFASASSDSGEHWSEAVAVDPNGGETDSSVPAVAVDGRGVVGIAWYDRRADPTDGCYQLFFAASRDGGATFDAAAPVDATRACPLLLRGSSAAKAPAEADPITSEYRFKNGGDTLGFVGLPQGGFQIAWIRPGRAELQLWSTQIRVR